MKNGISQSTGEGVRKGALLLIPGRKIIAGLIDQNRIKP
jgi:hypothetical protein